MKIHEAKVTGKKVAIVIISNNFNSQKSNIEKKIQIFWFQWHYGQTYNSIYDKRNDIKNMKIF